jgi:hypothetical protein
MSIENRMLWEAFLAILTGQAAQRSSDGADATEWAKDALRAFKTYCADDALLAEAMGRTENECPWTGHARVDLFGHISYVGRIREVRRFGADLGEVQELNPDGTYGKVHPFGGKALHHMDAMTLDEALEEIRQAAQRWEYCTNCKRGFFSYPGGPTLCKECRAPKVETPRPDGAKEAAALLQPGLAEQPPPGAEDRAVAAIQP